MDTNVLKIITFDNDIELIAKLKENIKKFRKARKFSQEDFAMKLCVVRQTVSKWEKGTSLPDFTLMKRYKEELGATVIAEGGKINLSIKRLEAKPTREFAPRPKRSATAGQPQGRPQRPAPTPPPAPKSADQAFEDLLKAFITESDSKISSIRRYSDHRTKNRRR